MSNKVDDIVIVLRSLESQRSAHKAELIKLLEAKSAMEKRGDRPTNLAAISQKKSQITALDRRIESLKASLR